MIRDMLIDFALQLGDAIESEEFKTLSGVPGNIFRIAKTGYAG